MIIKDEKGKVIVDTENLVDIPKPKLVKSPYHIKEIQKGIIGEISKIREELDELEDAEQQGIKVMIHVELSDLYGAIEFYAQNQGLTMEDLRQFSDLNKRAKSGKSN